MEAQYVATMPGARDSAVRHTLREGWTYSRISEARTGCGIKGPLAVEHRQSGTPITVTCKRRGCAGQEAQA